jgi:hypothetical protein
MSTHIGIDLRKLIAQGEQLVAERPYCHKTLNDQMAIVFMSKLAEKGYSVKVADAVSCLERMKIAVDSGVYPEELLRQAAKPAAV